MTQPTLSPKLQRLALINVCLGQFMTALDSRSVIVALPTISIYFDTSLAVVQWIPAGLSAHHYRPRFKLGLLGRHAGPQKDLRLRIPAPRPRVCVLWLSTGLWQLIAFRVLAGIGGAMVLANGRAVVSTLYAHEGRGRALGLTSMAFHLGYITGPSLGGFLIDTVGWRWIFFVSLPVALAAAFMAWKFLPETVSDKRQYSIDPMGMVTLLLTVVSLILGLQQIAKSGVGWFAITAFLIGAIFLGALLHVERKAPAPLLDLSLFRVRMLTAGIVSHFFVVISHSSTFFLLPFYLQGILHFTPTQVGVTIIFFSLVIVFLAPVGGWLGDRLGSRLLCTLGSIMTVISMLAFSRLGADAGHAAVIFPLMILGLGWSLFQSPNLSAVFSAVEPRHVGAVSGISLTAANIANAVGVAVASVLFMRWLNYYGLSGSVLPVYTQWAQSPEGFIKAFRSSWLVIAGLTAIAVVTSVLRGVDRRSRKDS
jgi:EmrB/QacA subfamily drug resistance transporter